MVELTEFQQLQHDHANKLQALAVALWNCEKLKASYDGLKARCEMAERERDELRAELQKLKGK